MSLKNRFERPRNCCEQRQAQATATRLAIVCRLPYHAVERHEFFSNYRLFPVSLLPALRATLLLVVFVGIEGAGTGQSGVHDLPG
jgi:hypothetical protein